MTLFRWVRQNPLTTLDVAKFILLLILSISFINFNFRLGDVITQQKRSQESNAAHIQTLSNHFDCVLALFKQPNRANFRIADIKNCQIIPSSSGGATGSTKSSSVVTHTPATTPVATKQTGSAAPMANPTISSATPPIASIPAATQPPPSVTQPTPLHLLQVCTALVVLPSSCLTL